MNARSSVAATILMALALGGCAGSIASYPSLAPRPEEQAAAPASSASATALDPAVAGRGAALAAEARRGAEAFDAAAAAGCAAIAHGIGAAEGSEAWIAAQQALSAIEAAQAPIGTALNDLDALVLDQARLAQDAPTAIDLTPLTDAAGEVAAIDAAQNARLAELREKGCRP